MIRRLLAVALLLTVLVPTEVSAQQQVVDLRLRVETPQGVRAESAKEIDFAIAGDVLFAFNQAILTPAAAAILSGLASEIRAQATGPVRIVGYTDSVGDDAFNLDLSRRRAKAVEGELRRILGSAVSDFATDGRGKADPVAPNKNPDGSDNPAGRARNRRVTATYAKRAAASSSTSSVPPRP